MFESKKMAGHLELMDGVAVHLVLDVPDGPDVLHVGVSKGVMLTSGKHHRYPQGHLQVCSKDSNFTVTTLLL